MKFKKNNLVVAIITILVGFALQFGVNTTPDLNFAGDSYVAVFVALLALAEYFGMTDIFSKFAKSYDFGEETDKLFLALDLLGVEVPANIQQVVRSGAVVIDKGFEELDKTSSG